MKYTTLVPGKHLLVTAVEEGVGGIFIPICIFATLIHNCTYVLPDVHVHKLLHLNSDVQHITSSTTPISLGA